MTEQAPERRRTPRTPGSRAFDILADEQSYPAELADISVAGLHARIDAMTFDEIRERIDGVRFGTAPPLAITLRWGFFDGNFGASFKDPLAAKPIVEEVIATFGKTPDDPPG